LEEGCPAVVHRHGGGTKLREGADPKKFSGSGVEDNQVLTLRLCAFLWLALLTGGFPIWIDLVYLKCRFTNLW
jgi:hypothetical protein